MNGHASPVIAVRILLVVGVVAVAGFASGCGDSEGDSGASGATAAQSTELTGASGATPGEGGSGEASAATGGEENQAGDTGDSSDSNSSAGTGFKPEPPPIQLFTDNTSGIKVDKPTVLVARSKKQLDSLVERQSRAPVNQPRVSVNFGEKRQVFAVVLPSSPKGTQVTVTGVESNGEATRVKALVLTPGSNCKVGGPSKIRPTAWVETRRLPGKPTLVIERTKTTC